MNGHFGVDRNHPAKAARYGEKVMRFAVAWLQRNVFKVKWSDKSVLKLCLEDVLKHIVEDDAKWTSRCKQRGGVAIN